MTDHDHEDLELAREEREERQRERQRALAGRGIAARLADHNAVRRAGGSPRDAIAAYCAGNRWLTENARAVGNLPEGE